MPIVHALPLLSPHEQRLIRLLRSGLTVREIADRIGLKPRLCIQRVTRDPATLIASQPRRLSLLGETTSQYLTLKQYRGDIPAWYRA